MPTPNSLFVDTAGWASILGRDETYHREMNSAYRRAIAQRRRLFTSNYVIAEVVALLSSRVVVSRQRMIAFIDALKAAPHLQILHVDRAVDEAAWELLKARSDKDWSLVDAASFVLMQRYGIGEALTTDHHFEQAGFVRLPAL